MGPNSTGSAVYLLKALTTAWQDTSPEDRKLLSAQPDPWEFQHLNRQHSQAQGPCMPDPLQGRAAKASASPNQYLCYDFPSPQEPRS